MKSNTSLLYNVFLVVGDFLALVGAFLAAFVVRANSTVPVAHPIAGQTYLYIFLTLLPFWILIFALLGLYRTNIYERRFAEAGRLLIGSFIGFLFVLLWNFLSSTPIFPAKLVPIYGFVFAFIFLLVFRNLVRAIRSMLFNYGVGLTRVVLVGDTPATAELVIWLGYKHSGYKVVATVGGKTSSFASWEAFLASEPGNVHVIMQTELFKDESRNTEILDYAQKNHIAYRFVPGNTELFVGNIDVELFRNSLPVIAVRQTPLFGWGAVVKRLFDIVVSGILLILTSWLFALIALAEWISGAGSVFYHHGRLTRYNTVFQLYKFRSQYKKYDGTTPEQAFELMGKPELAAAYRAAGDQLPDDPRVTKLGKFLRATSLDELPQLFSIFKGDISLVGPRALIPEELSAYEKKHTILSVKSGLTGLAAVSGRRDIPFEERRRLDVYYVQNWSFWLDLVILAKTVRVVLNRTGAK